MILSKHTPRFRTTKNTHPPAQRYNCPGPPGSPGRWCRVDCSARRRAWDRIWGRNRISRSRSLRGGVRTVSVEKSQHWTRHSWFQRFFRNDDDIVRFRSSQGGRLTLCTCHRMCRKARVGNLFRTADRFQPGFVYFPDRPAIKWIKTGTCKFITTRKSSWHWFNETWACFAAIRCSQPWMILVSGSRSVLLMSVVPVRFGQICQINLALVPHGPGLHGLAPGHGPVFADPCLKRPRLTSDQKKVLNVTPVGCTRTRVTGVFNRLYTEIRESNRLYTELREINRLYTALRESNQNQL